MSKTKYKIVLVEDEPNVALLFKFNLTKAGFDCEIGTNGREGFELVKKHKPDLIISDIMMPEVDGYEFRKMLLQESEYKEIPFVFLTAKGSEDDIISGYDLDIEDYIIKTSSPKIVIKKINAIFKSLEKERNKVVGELNKAADNMGAKVVPDSAPSVKNFEIKHWHQPFENIPGGDFIDYIKINDDQTVVILGDVMGKKWGAWYFAYAYSGYIRSAIRVVIQNSDTSSPAEIMKKVNESVYEDERISEVFTTLSVVIINSKTNKISYTGAGDLPLFYKNSASGKVEAVKSNGLLLGFSKTSEFEDTELTLSKGDFVMITTDGITESTDKNDIQFQPKGVISALEQIGEEDPVEFMRNIIHAYTEGNYEDDMSMITIKAI